MYHYMAMEKVGMVKMQILMNKDIYVREEVELIPVLLQGVQGVFYRVALGQAKVCELMQQCYCNNILFTGMS
jgi:hypothetical protein